MKMRRGTTPTLTISTDISLVEASNFYLTFKQGDRVAFEKTLEDVTITEASVICELDQNDTLALEDGLVRFQIRATLGDSKVASNIMTANADEILKGGAI
jgi:pyruvate kinase